MLYHNIKQLRGAVKKATVSYLSLMCIILSGCSTSRPDTIMQVSTIDSLIAGNYDGHMSCGELLKNGDFGLGTFQGLDGEMVVLDGKIYQIKADGNVYSPDLNTGSPFASVCSFKPEKTVSIENKTDFKAMEDIIDMASPNKNLFCAIRIDGDFNFMETRSVPAQKKTYSPLSEITKNQPRFKMRNISGTIVGFRCPSFVKGLNVPGYHLHFLSKDRTNGGHILSFETENAECKIDVCNVFHMVLPKDDDVFGGTDLTKNRSADLQKIEK